MYASRRRPIEKVVVPSIHGYVSIYRRPDEHLNIHKSRCEIPPTLAGQRSHCALDGVLKPLLMSIWLVYPSMGYSGTVAKLRYLIIRIRVYFLRVKKLKL
jgi:hypothetical protein